MSELQSPFLAVERTHDRVSQRITVKTRDQNSRSHTVARNRCEFAAIRDVSTQIHFESAVKTRRKLTVNIHSETLSREGNGLSLTKALPLARTLESVAVHVQSKYISEHMVKPRSAAGEAYRAN